MNRQLTGEIYRVPTIIFTINSHLEIIISVTKDQTFGAERLERFFLPLTQALPRNLSARHNIQDAVLG